jgi:hypothetical protein
MTIAYSVAASIFILIEMNVITELMGWRVSPRAGIANPQNYLIWADATESTKRALQLQQYWNAISKTALCAVVFVTILSTEPLIRCITSIMICICVTMFYLYMGPTLQLMEQHEEVAPGQYRAVNILAIFLVIVFAVMAVLEGLEIQ